MMKNFDNIIPLFWDADMLQEGKQEYISWDVSRAPHIAIFGQTGSGKSYGSKLLAARLSTHLACAKAVICTYKGGSDSDFHFLSDSPRYFEYERCTEGLDFFFKAFQARQSGANTSRAFRLFLFDEWSGYINSLTRRQAEEETKKLGTALMLGRSYNFHIMVIQQRGDSSYFATARDNFNVVVGLGNLSKESRDMFFSSFKDNILPVHQQGEGYLIMNGNLRHIQVPAVTNTDKLHEAIRRLVI